MWCRLYIIPFQNLENKQEELEEAQQELKEAKSTIQQLTDCLFEKEDCLETLCAREEVRYLSR